MLEVRCDEKAPSKAPPTHPGVSEVQVESSEQRAARLLTLRHAIDAGAYKIPADSVANKIIDSMRSRPKPEATASTDKTSAGPRERSAAAARRTVEPSDS